MLSIGPWKVEYPPGGKVSLQARGWESCFEILALLDDALKDPQEPTLLLGVLEIPGLEVSLFAKLGAGLLETGRSFRHAPAENQLGGFSCFLSSLFAGSVYELQPHFPWLLPSLVGIQGTFVPRAFTKAAPGLLDSVMKLPVVDERLLGEEAIPDEIQLLPGIDDDKLTIRHGSYIGHARPVDLHGHGHSSKGHHVIAESQPVLAGVVDIPVETLECCIAYGLLGIVHGHPPGALVYIQPKTLNSGWQEHFIFPETEAVV